MPVENQGVYMSHGQIDQLQSGREANPSILQIGDKIGNHYEIYDILGGEGKSGMGIIYVCYDHDNKGVFALKTLQDRYRTSEETNKQFEREALVWIELERHPYIVRAWWVEKIEGRLFVTLEYIAPDERGRNTLTHYLRDLSLTDILKISIQFCHGMEYAHSRGINAHRDIKPDNIMITYNSTVKITDFGLSKAFQEIDIECDTISEFVQAGLSIFKSKSNKICGTLPYMAPEQFDGFADYRSDVYSFGIVLFQMANKGELPYVGKNPEEFEQLHKFAPTPYFFSPLFPIINKCLQKATSCRYKTFTLLREDLEKLLLSESGESIAIPADRKSVV
jgi:serine/threonine protein kinase